MGTNADNSERSRQGAGFPRPDELLSSRFFAVPHGAARDRRPTDVTMLVFTSFVLALFAIRADSGTRGFEAAVRDVVDNLPSFLDPVFRIAHDALLVWAAIIVLLALVRRQWGLVRDLFAVAVVVFAASALVGRWAVGSWPDLWDALIGTDGPVDYPAFGLALWVGLSSAASSHLSRPYRYLGRWIITLGALAAIALGVTPPGGALGRSRSVLPRPPRCTCASARRAACRRSTRFGLRSPASAWRRSRSRSCGERAWCRRGHASSTGPSCT